VNHPSEKVKVGDKIDVMVLQVDRQSERVSLGLKQKSPDPWLDVEDRYPVGEHVKGRVVNIVDYGAFVELEEGVEGLLHVSEMSWTRRIVHPNRVFKRGDEIEAVVLDIDRDSQRISLGLRQLQDNPWNTITQRYPVGTKITGKVRNLTDFGAFVEVEEGIDGLIHVSDLSWAKRVVNPSEVLKEGDEVEVLVLSIDAEHQRISLGLKQVEPDPWVQVPERFKVGSVVQGTIVNLTSFGAFAKLDEGVEGLIHISELADHHVNKPEEVVAVGQILDLKVISLDPIERRIGLSLKAYLNEQTRAQVEQYRDTGRRAQQQQREEEPRPSLLGALLQEELNQANARRQEQGDE
jgi:small subunit ribosomal protein S1